MAFRLPPLNALRLFEAAGRHLSFKLAAHELGVTPSAVSHGVQGLEDWLGAPLFARCLRGLVLTEAGVAYLATIRESLMLLATASETLPGRRVTRRIRISAPPTFTARLLLPRLGRFRERHPDVTLVIDTPHHHAELAEGGADLAIRMGRGEWPGLAAEHLMHEDLVPVCAPALLERCQGRDPVMALPRIRVTTVSQDWETWLRAAGRPVAGGVDGLRIDTVLMAFDAAVRGMGIVLGRRPLVDQELHAGTLIPVAGPVVRSPTPYWLVGHPEIMERPDIRTFRTWLRDELAADARAIPPGAGPGPWRGRRVTMALDLPPLNTLRMFEAAGRLGTFRQAAEELHVTPSAVSHGVLALEKWLGIRLFVRLPGGLVPTEPGALYLPVVRAVLDRIAAASERASGRRPRGNITISVAPTFASSWLLPRMPRFSEAHPDVAITVSTTRRQVNLPLESVDLVIRMAARRQPAGVWFRLMRERLVPVLAPALWQRLGHMPVADILRQLALIHVTTARRDWQAFDDLIPPRPGRPSGDFRFDTIQMALQAAAQGLGIAVGRRPLVDRELAEGRLVALPVAERDAGTAYWLVGLPVTFERPGIKAFRRWLLDEIGTGATPAALGDTARPATTKG